ncbi:hypothetical protein [Cellulomonas sp. HD19AZ1]|uniref:hypothetical protein n=1 Tax=Cellulomonas sp. HD19AZ1 TaxID=2559593 RepID=UPI001070EBB6|nr:hypothetical protein [Cellulomonas sp. HD19AZ1]TFH69448.1 hypothetical protein E4A51_15425 [Cellulomonas sp. HD19AZ1]
MFRSFLLFSNTKWNRTEMITPRVFGTLRGSFIGLPRATGVRVPVTVAEPGRYRVLARTAPTANTVHVTSSSLAYDRTFEFRAPPGDVQLYPVDQVYETDREPVDTSTTTVAEVERAIPDELVPVNFGYGYQDLGVVDATAGTHTFALDKTDTNPLLLEGLALVPEDVWAGLALPPDVTTVDDPDALGCSERTASAGGSDGYVDPAANPEHANLTSDELLALAAADVQDLEPPPGGVVGSSQLGVGLTVALLVASVLLVRWRPRLHPDDEPDGPGPGPDDGPDARTHHDDTDQEAP